MMDPSDMLGAKPCRMRAARRSLERTLGGSAEADESLDEFGVMQSPELDNCH